MKKALPTLKIQKICRLFGVPISSYYKQQKEKSDPIELFIIGRIKAIHKDNFQSYGRRRMVVALKNEGINLGVFKVAKLMKDAGVTAKTPKKPHYYPSGNEKPTIPNLLKRQFNPKTIDTHWAGDITYVRHHQGWSYLATVLDLSTKEIIGYALSKTPDAQLAKQALKNAISLH